MSYDEKSAQRAVDTTIANLSSLRLDGSDVTQLVASLDAALIPIFVEIYAILMRLGSPPIPSPPPIEFGLMAGFLQDAQLLEEAGQQMKRCIVDRENFSLLRKRFPNNDLGYLLGQSTVALYNLMDIVFPTRGRIDPQHKIKRVEISVDDNANFLSFFSWPHSK